MMMRINYSDECDSGDDDYDHVEYVIVDCDDYDDDDDDDLFYHES